MSKYRHRVTPPVPIHAACNDMAAAMHREIKALHALLLAAADDMGVSPEDTERAIVRMIEIKKEEA